MATKTTRTDTTETSVTEATPDKGAPRRGPSLNRVSLIGRIASDPVLRYTPKGVAVTNFRLANNGTYRVQFHTIVAWRGLAETAAKYLSKGRLAYVSGRLSSRTWTGQDGQSRWALEIIAEDIQFLSARVAGYPPAAVAA
jgi:single-strand DNA-binding protein